MLFLIPTKITPLQYTLIPENTQVSYSYLHTRTCIHMYLKNCHRERLRLRVFILHNTKLSFTFLSTQWCVDGYVTWLTTYVCANKKKIMYHWHARIYIHTHTHKRITFETTRIANYISQITPCSYLWPHIIPWRRTSDAQFKLLPQMRNSLVGGVNYFGNDGASSFDNVVSTGT